MPFLLPCLALALWLIHLVATLRGEHLPWVTRAWMFGLPLALAAVVLYWVFFVPPPDPNMYEFWDPNHMLWMFSVVLCFAAWITFLILEIFVQFFAHRARTRRATKRTSTIARPAIPSGSKTPMSDGPPAS